MSTWGRKVPSQEGSGCALLGGGRPGAAATGDDGAYERGLAMKWVTRENANVDRIACPWLIKRFIDPDAEFLFVPRDQVLEVAEREGAHSYDAPGAEYTHRDGKCSFDVLVEEFTLTNDAALVRLAQIVHAADVS